MRTSEMNYLALLLYFQDSKSLIQYLQMQGNFSLLENKDKLMRMIDYVLEALLNQTKYIRQEKTPFHYLSEPSIQISQYLRRISTYAHCSLSVYVGALILIDRIQQENEDFFVTSRCIHRILLTSIILAAKNFDDFYYKNSYYAKVGGLTLKELNNLELKYLQLLNFNTHINPQTFNAYMNRLEELDIINQKQN